MEIEKQAIETVRGQLATAEMNTLRVRIADLVETIGQAAGLMREAAVDAEQESMGSALLCADDACEMLHEAKGQISELINGLVSWKGVDP